MNESAELKKDYTDILSKIPDYFWQAFAGELAAIFGFDIFNPWIVDAYESTAGWGMAFEVTCKKLDLDWLWHLYDGLDWEESDLFDDEVQKRLKQNLYDITLQDIKPYWLWLVSKYRRSLIKDWRFEDF